MKNPKNITFLRELMNKPIRKMLAFLIFVAFSTNIFSTAVDPISISNSKITKTATGIEQLDIATPNANGTSYNSLRELQVSEQGLIINNNPHIVTDTKIAGLVVRNRNLDNGVAANLIITEVTGKNRTNINGYVEIAGNRADLVMANRNGITVNGGGFLNSDRVTLTTGSLNMENGNLVGIDVSESDIAIGEKGLDALSLADLELISKTINIEGIIKASNETKVLISTGGQTYKYKTKEVKSKGETYKGIAVDAKNAGSMYAGKIDILSNDKGAGVNTQGELVSVDDITITASGDITTNKVATNKKVKYSTNKKVKLKGATKAGKKVVVKSNEVEIDAKVITGFLEENLGKSAFETDSDKMTISSSGGIESYGKAGIKSKFTENRGEIYSTEKMEISGQKLDNTEGTVRSNGSISLDMSETKNVKGYILSDGLTKEEVDRNNNKENNSKSIENIEYGINISGNVDNNQGMIKGRNISIGGNITNDSGIINSIVETKLYSDILSNNKGNIITNGKLELNGKKINNEKGVIKGNISKLSQEEIINNGGQLISIDKIEGVVKNISNEKGELFGENGVNLISDRINNLVGIIRSNGKIEVNNKSLINNGGYILSDGLTKEQTDNWKKIKMKEKVGDDDVSTANGKNIDSDHGINIKSDRLENIKGIIASLTSTKLNIGKISNEKGSVLSKGIVEFTTAGDYIYDGKIEGDKATKIKGNTITVNDNIRRDSVLELIGNNGLILKEDILARVLKLETEKDLKNQKQIKGTKALILKGNNISNSGNILSDDYLEITAKNNLTNETSGTIKGLGNTYLEAKSIYNRRGNILSDTKLALISDMLINNNAGIVKSIESVYAEVKNGDFKNINGGIIEGRKNLKIKADNIYNTQSYNQEKTVQDGVSSGKGGRIIGENVYLEALNKVINGEEAYAGGTYRREDGTLIDNRLVNFKNESLIAGNKFTTIKANSLINTSDIGMSGAGRTYIETKNTTVNASIGSNIAKINGSEVYIKSKDEVNNIGGQIKGNHRTQVISEIGKVFNQSTVLQSEEPKLLTESIRNIGKIESDGIVYVQGKDLENIGGNIQGEQGTYLKADNNVEDRTIILKYKGNEIIENGVNWNELERKATVSGILGLGGNTLIESGNDIILESSNLKGSDDIVLDAKNYILMLSTINTEYKYRTETHKRGGGLRRKKVTTNTWIEDNAYANGVDITTNGNILMNYKGKGLAPDNKGIFAQGVNFNAGGQIYGLSDGNIYIQGTKDLLSNVFNSQTTKSYFGVKYSKKSDYISENREKYKLSQLYGNAGITVDAEGKLKVEGADILSKGNVFLRGKLGTDILPGTEAYSKYEEYKRMGFKGSLSGDFFAGVEKTKEEFLKDKITNIGTRINSDNGKVEISGDTVYVQGAKIGAKENIVLAGRNGTVVEDALNYEKNEHNKESIRMGISGSADRKNMGASIGLNTIYALNDKNQAYLYPERSILVSDRNIYIKSNDGNIYFQGEAGANGKIVIISENGTVYIKDSQNKINANSKNIKANAFFGLTGNAGGIKETLKSYKDYVDSIKALRDTGKVLRLVKDLVKGEDIYETLEGREDAVNAINTYLKGPNSGGVSGGLSVVTNYEQGKSISEYIKNITTNIRSGEGIVLKANNIDFYGGNIESQKNIIIDAKNININASEDKYKDKFQNIELSGQYTIYGTRGGSGSIDFQKGEREGTVYNNTQITAGNILNIKSDDLSIKGGNLRGRITDVESKNLLLESIQDTEKYREIGSGISVSISKGGRGSKGKGAGSGSVSLVKGDKNWVGDQSSITGSEQLTLSAENTYIKGGIIGNIDENGNDKGNLDVSISKLTLEDIQNEDKRASVGIKAGFSQRSEVPTYNRVYIKDKNGKYIATGNKIGISFGMSLSGFDKEKITRATIGSGILTVNEIKGQINRDITKADEIIKDKNVSTINIDYSNTKRKWGQIGEIMANHSGTIGAIVDDLREQIFGANSENYSEKWSEAVYFKYRKAEDFIDRKLYNDKVPIIPTAGQHGGMLEGIEKIFTKDKFPIYNLTLKEQNGEIIITGNKVNHGSEITNTEIFINGMTEETENAIGNAVNQLVSRSKDTRDKLHNGEPVNITLLYSPTRGNWIDGVESVLGKLFDGSGMAGLTLGTSRGLADVLMQLNPDKHYNITSYSQANIVVQGALNYLKNNGIKLREGKEKNNIVIYHTGTPKSSKIFDDLEESVGFKNGVSIINRLDPIGSDEGAILKTKGLISEIRDYNLEESSWTAWKKYFRWVPILRSSLSQQSYPVLDTPNIKEFEPGGSYADYKKQIMSANNLKNDKEFKNFVEYYHRWYNIDDRNTVYGISSLIKGYETATEKQKAFIEAEVSRIRKERIKALVEGWALGFPISTENIENFRTRQLYEEYKNNRGAEWQENYRMTQTLNINRELDIYRYNKKIAEGLEGYIKRLKDEVR